MCVQCLWRLFLHLHHVFPFRHIDFEKKINFCQPEIARKTFADWICNDGPWEGELSATNSEHSSCVLYFITNQGTLESPFSGQANLIMAPWVYHCWIRFSGTTPTEQLYKTGGRRPIERGNSWAQTDRSKEWKWSNTIKSELGKSYRQLNLALRLNANSLQYVFPSPWRAITHSSLPPYFGSYVIQLIWLPFALKPSLTLTTKQFSCITIL